MIWLVVLRALLCTQRPFLIFWTATQSSCGKRSVLHQCTSLCGQLSLRMIAFDQVGILVQATQEPKSRPTFLPYLSASRGLICSHLELSSVTWRSRSALSSCSCRICSERQTISRGSSKINYAQRFHSEYGCAAEQLRRRNAK